MISVYYCLRAGYFSQKFLVESKHCISGNHLLQTNILVKILFLAYHANPTDSLCLKKPKRVFFNVHKVT